MCVCFVYIYPIFSTKQKTLAVSNGLAKLSNGPYGVVTSLLVLASTSFPRILSMTHLLNFAALLLPKEHY